MSYKVHDQEKCGEKVKNNTERVCAKNILRNERNVRKSTSEKQQIITRQK